LRAREERRHLSRVLDGMNPSGGVAEVARQLGLVASGLEPQDLLAVAGLMVRAELFGAEVARLRERFAQGLPPEADAPPNGH
jgi:hypothetical protein